MDRASRPLRVAMVVDRFPDETFLAQDVAELLGRGIDVHVLCQIHDRSADAWTLLDAVDLSGRVHPWPDSDQPRRRLVAAGSALARAVRTDRRGLQRAAATELDRSRSRSTAVGRVLFDARVVAIAPDVLHFQFADLARRRIHAAAATGAAFTASFRGYDLSYTGLDRPGFYDELWPVLDGAHTLGQDLRRLAIERGCPAELDWAIIAPAVDHRRLVPPAGVERGDLGSDDALRIVSVGRLHWKKGYDWALAAIADAVADGLRVDYRIVGSGEHENAVRWAVHDLGLDEVVTLVGHADVSEVVAQLRWADIFLHPALTEGFGNAVLEAQAMAVPVICSDAEGLAENVLDGRTGFVVARRDEDMLRARLEVLARDEERRVAMGRAGRERVVADFGLEAHTDAFVEFFERAARR